MIKIAVCDDNEVMLEKLMSVISKAFEDYTKDFIVKRFSSGILLLCEHKSEPFDILFLDIDMPKITGFDIAKALRDVFSNCFIIFITSHSELIYESMDFQPFHFIRKNYKIPIEENIKEIVQKLMKHMKQNDKLILEDDLSGRCATYIRNIVYIESDKHYVNYYIKDRENPIRMRENITECVEKLIEYDFIRIHRRFCINMRFLLDLDSNNNEVTLSVLHKHLPMSKNLKKEVDEKYTVYLRSKV